MPSPRGSSSLHTFAADIFPDGPRTVRWRAYARGADGGIVIETDGSEPGEELARQAAKEWIFNQARLLYGA